MEHFEKMSSQTVSEGVACIKPEYIWVKPEVVVESDKRCADDVSSEIGPEAKKLKSDTNGNGQVEASENLEKKNGNESKRSQRKRGLAYADANDTSVICHLS